MSEINIMAIMFWVREVKVNEFLEKVWVQAFVENDDCIKDGADYVYDFDWINNRLIIQSLRASGIPSIKITHNLVLYRHAFDAMKMELMNVIGTSVLPDYLKGKMEPDDYKFLTNMTHIRHSKKGLSFSYFDNLDIVEEGIAFSPPEFYYWYKYSSIFDIVYRENSTRNTPNFMEDIYYRVCQRMERKPDIDNINTGCWKHTKECFYQTFPSAEYLDELMTENKDILCFYEEKVPVVC